MAMHNPFKLCRDPKQFFRFVQNYNPEFHEVQTDDGYILSLYRMHSNIPSMLKSTKPKGNNR